MVRTHVAGLILFIGGGAVTSYAGSRYAAGALAQDRARRDWDQRAAHATVSAVLENSTRLGFDQPLTEGTAVARLMIPKIGLDDIVLEGVGSDDLNGGPGHYPGTPLPGSRGNSIISGHRDRHFRRLGDLIIGDTIRTESNDRIATWVVTSRRVLSRAAAELQASSIPTLTLTTCWPIDYLGPAPDRLILAARLATREKN
jgi:sortase A